MAQTRTTAPRSRIQPARAHAAAALIAASFSAAAAIPAAAQAQAPQPPHAQAAEQSRTGGAPAPMQMGGASPLSPLAATVEGAAATPAADAPAPTATAAPGDRPGGADPAAALPPADPGSTPAPAQDAEAAAAPPAMLAALPAPADRAAAIAWRFLSDGGPSIIAIALLSVVTLALILWKIWAFSVGGAWPRGDARRAAALWETGEHAEAAALLARARGLRARFARAAMTARLRLPEDRAREETARVARALLNECDRGLRPLELIAAIAPLLGLLGTVLGMIAAFQALQEAGSRADPSQLAGGIWEALLTTAAGMAVAIPASMALTWAESVIAALRGDMEDLGARIFVAPGPRREGAAVAAAPRAAE